MDLKRYLQVSARRWWVVLLAVLIAGGATAYRVMPQPDVYESKATFVVRPNESVAGDEIRAIDTLIRGGSINATYASIARSRLIRDRSLDRMDADVPTRGLRARAEVVAGTNLLSITVRNEDPQLAHDFLEVVSAETVSYVQTVDDAYRLEPLDPPSIPSEPVDARKNLTIALGVMLGLAVGVGLAMLIEYLRSPSSAHADRASDDIITADGGVSDDDQMQPDLVGVARATYDGDRARENPQEPEYEYVAVPQTHRDRLSNGDRMPAVVKDWNGVARVIRTFGSKSTDR